GAIGDFVWHDLNRNGIQDAGEPGINNVTVRLYDSINTLVGRTTTVTFGGHDGYYQFTGLAAGTYQVVVDTTPSGYSATTGNAPSATTANDSNGSPATVTLASNVSTDETIDFGYVSPCAGVIGDFVWNDLNHNGIQDSGETGISGITLNLYDSNHVLLLSTTTDANGLYQFTGRCAGDYSVEVVPPAGSAAALTNASGSTAANDSNGSPATLTLGIDETNNTIDFGYYFGSIAANCVTIDAIQGVAITPVTMTATGGTGGYTYSAIGLPNGLSMSSGGTLSGTPTVSGTFNYTVTVTDKDGHTGTVSCSVTVNPPPTATCVVINAVQSVAITPVTMTATGGTGTGYTFSATGLPAGLTISSSGTISGTPTVSGIFNYTVTVTDGGGHTGTVNCSVTVTPPPNMCGLTWGYWKNHPWSTNSLLLGSHTYSQTELSALLGMPVQGDASINLAHQLIAAKFNVLNGTNPATDGGSIGAADALLNQFSAKLPYNFDPNSTVGQQMTTVAGQLDWFNSDGAAQPGCSAGPAPLTLTCAARTGQVGVAYSSAFAVSGGLAPYTFSIISGSLPSGLTLDPATAAVTGTPTTAGTFNFTIEVADATAVPGSITGTKTLDCSITIEPTKPTLTVKCPTGSATVGVVYSSSVTASGGTAPYSYGIYSGNLPAGLNLSAGGSLTGTPTGSGTYSFVVYAIDSTKAAYGYSPCTIVVSGGIVTGQFTTYTQGGWGAPAKGKNVGALLTSKFLAVYPGASVSIGGAYKLTFKSALAITNFLPQGATPGQLTANATNPTASRAGVFAGQVLALQLNVDFSNTGLLPTGLANLKVASGPMAGQTVMQVLATANAVLGGGALPKGMTISTLNSVVDAINNNFDGGMANKGYLLP
ncbi:MAG: putative Ig domain-containing protein, partial [Acidobacteriia bacterium]|nr:putative Ig domain-containing protein [Terriglobia bacterium]